MGFRWWLFIAIGFVILILLFLLVTVTTLWVEWLVVCYCFVKVLGLLFIA